VVVFVEKRALFAPILFLFVAHGASAGSIVSTTDGAVAGATLNGVDVFRGVPFAAPPIGDLRWRAPQPVKAWSGARDATKNGNDCFQTPYPENMAPLNAPLSEDCLYLNVWRPEGAAAGAKLPVLVWIHGGGFVTGGASAPVFNGDSFARKHVIMVGINYRLGRFGFFAHPALIRENKDHGLLGNYGYLDQIAALRWVQKNIAAFGGDPANVTVFGESAGGASVLVLMTSPLTEGLFQRAIVQSGGGRGNILGERRVTQDQPGLPSLETVGMRFAHSIGVDGAGPDALARLRALPTKAVDGGLGAVTVDGPPEYGGPSVDGAIVVTAPDAVLKGKTHSRIPLIVGSTSADLGLGARPTKETTFASFGAHAAEARAAYDPDGRVPDALVTAQVAADRTMVEPARYLARTLSGQGVPAYLFRFSYVADSMTSRWDKGAPHASDVPYAINTVAEKYRDKVTAKDRLIADAMNSYWANFAKTGDPNGPGLPKWRKYSAGSEKDMLMDFSARGVPEMVVDPRSKQLDVVSAAQ
jgi:para-nitrobenzyl esterase